MSNSSAESECPQGASPKLVFAGFIGGLVGAIVPTFAQITPDRTATVQAWLAAGAKGAAFTVTNDYSRTILVWAIARIRSGGASDEAPLLSATNFSGILVEPGQSCPVPIAMIARAAPWQALFFYNYRVSCAERRALGPQELWLVQRHTIQSDWIQSMPTAEGAWGAEPGAPPKGGPTKSPANSVAMEGPPSVSFALGHFAHAHE